jgi:hypothetical protein
MPYRQSNADVMFLGPAKVAGAIALFTLALISAAPSGLGQEYLL